MARMNFDEAPSLVQLYGEEIQNDIAIVARQTGIDPDDLQAAIEDDPEMLGEYYDYMGQEVAGPPAPLPRGQNFANVFSTIMQGVSKSAPDIAAAARAAKARGGAMVPTGGGVPATRGGFDPMTLMLPAAGLVALLVIMNMRKKA